MITKWGFFKASTHEKTSDLSMLAKMNQIFIPKNINKQVEDELVQFRQEIEAKFAQCSTKSFRMFRVRSTKSSTQQSLSQTREFSHAAKNNLIESCNLQSPVNMNLSSK